MRTNDSATKSAPSSAASVEIGDVLLRDRRKLRTGVGDVDALARGQRSRGQHPGEDLTGRHALDGQARHAVADHDLRALGRQRGEVREVDAHAVGRRRSRRCRRRRPPRLPAARASPSRPTAAASAPAGRTAGRAAAGRARPSRAPRRPCRRRSSWVPCEQFRRAQFTPAATSRSSTPGGSVAGPSVATIFVRRPNIGPVSQSGRSRPCATRPGRRSSRRGGARRAGDPKSHRPATSPRYTHRRSGAR